MIQLKKLSRNDGLDVFEMLKGIGKVENSFTNPTCGMTFCEFKEWLKQQEQWDKGEMLPDGYVAQSIFWLYDNDKPIGIGKIRHELTEDSRKNGGNIGYAISSLHRGKGYGGIILKLLLEEAQKIGVNEIILTIDKNNIPSKNVCEKNGGVLIDENNDRWFYSIK
jgi:predicted acetyltransferase